tara:strand:+ start:19500 stop:19748 length:249 start_codon:yes stop_codon:yes gene_type:complete
MEKGREEIERFGIEESAGYKNLIAVQEYSKVTREMFRLLQGENKRLLDQVKQQNLAMELLRKQMTTLQVEFYQNRATQNPNK